jgi:hypothetical protein
VLFVLCWCRLILFLQQSSVEWASSLWLKVVQELDPQFQRTVRPGRQTAVQFMVAALLMLYSLAMQTVQFAVLEHVTMDHHMQCRGY